MWCFLFYTLISGTLQINSVSLDDAIPSKIKEDDVNKSLNRTFVLDYLIKYGFIDEKDNQPDMTSGVSSFQGSVGLPVTGELDARTLKLMSAPRCGVIDRRQYPTGHGNVRRKRYLLRYQKWHKPDNVLTWKITQYTSQIRQAETQYLLFRAFRLWSDVTNLIFRRQTSGSTDLKLGFYRRQHSTCRKNPFDGTGGTLGHGYYPSSGVVHFDDDETWLTGKEKGKDGTLLLPVAMHEIGHALGLSHTDVPQAIMYAINNPTTYPHPDDVAAIQYYYGRKTPEPTEPLWQRNVASLAPEGDWITLRKTTVPSTPAPTTPAELPPRLCDSTLRVNALERIGGETFIFSGKWYWRVPAGGGRRRIRHDWHTANPIKGLWPRLPLPESGLDAVYMRKSSRSRHNELIIFVGNKYWKASSNQLSNIGSTSRRITDFHLPWELQKVDAVFSLNDDVTYFLSGSNYWRYDDRNRRTLGKKTLDTWKGLRTPVDAAFNHSNGEVYFLQGSQIIKFNLENMRVSNDNGFPKPWMTHFFGCEKVAPPGSEGLPRPPGRSPGPSSATSLQIFVGNLVFAVLSGFLILL